jgi:hypothetical protein
VVTFDGGVPETEPPADPEEALAAILHRAD